MPHDHMFGMAVQLFSSGRMIPNVYITKITKLKADLLETQENLKQMTKLVTDVEMVFGERLRQLEQHLDV